jgi:hypothetical protein
MRGIKKEFKRKYLWSSEPFNDWIRKQQNQMRDKGFDIGPAEVTQKLYNDIIIPWEVKLIPPKMERRVKGKLIKKRIY